MVENLSKNVRAVLSYVLFRIEQSAFSSLTLKVSPVPFHAFVIVETSSEYRERAYPRCPWSMFIQGHAI